MSLLVRNRLLYAVLACGVMLLAFIYGGWMPYMTLYALLLLPLFSYAITGLALYSLRVTQHLDSTTVVKNESNVYYVTLKNNLPIPCENIHCLFVDDHLAIKVDDAFQRVTARPFKGETHTLRYTILFRGEYQVGLRALEMRDLTGLFRLRRKLSQGVSVTVLPRIIDLPYFPIAMNLVTQALSNYEIREEDYANVSDIRLYVPPDSVKRVHWKLSAKRNEWMVKIFQSNALSSLYIIMDTDQMNVGLEDSLLLQDRMIESTLAVIYYCLKKHMQVEWLLDGDVTKTARLMGDFNEIYAVAAGLRFEGSPERNMALTLLHKHINEAVSYLNIVIATARLDEALFERVATANHAGHNIALLYFPTDKADAEYERIFRQIADSGVSCRRIDSENALYEVS